MAGSLLTRLELRDFKSYSSETLKLEPMTLLIGRNGSGKSNALDAISLLALLAEERDVNDLERGDQEVAGLRGGLTGAAPYGRPNVRVGCTVDTQDGHTLSLELELDASTTLEVVSERLLRRQLQSSAETVLIDARRQQPGGGIAEAHVYSGGAPRSYQLLSSRLAVVQALTKVHEDTRARRLVVDSCRQLVAALRGVFVLDPVPAQMREYVRIGSPPNRSGSTLSALIHRLREDDDAWTTLVQLVRGLVEAEVVDITFFEGRLPNERLVDVMVGLVERGGPEPFTAPARLMSDGTLRYLAIVASLLSLRSNSKGADDAPRRTLVVEEIENGLFPSQSAKVLDLLRNEARERQIRLIATTHSPALLDALKPEDHAGVIICDRAKDGRSTLRRLVDHSRYVEIAGGGAIGQAVAKGMLEMGPGTRRRSLAELFAS